MKQDKPEKYEDSLENVNLMHGIDKDGPHMRLSFDLRVTGTDIVFHHQERHPLPRKDKK